VDFSETAKQGGLLRSSFCAVCVAVNMRHPAKNSSTTLVSNSPKSLKVDNFTTPNM
jgi:hypothetical protein